MTERRTVASGEGVAVASRSRRRHWGAVLQENPIYAAAVSVISRFPRLANAMVIVIPVAFIVIWNVFPLIEMLRISFLDEFPARISGEPQVTAQHYITLFTDGNAIRPFLRTMMFALCVAGGTLIVTLPIAYFLAKRVPANLQIRLLILVIIPSWVSEIIRVFSHVLLFASNGAVNIVLQWGGIIDKPIPILYSWFTLSGGVLYVSALFMLVPLYAAIEKVPNQVLEAASDLGAGKLQRFFKVTLPLIRDGIATGVVLVFLTSTGMYVVPVILAGPDTHLFAQVIAANFYESNLAWPRGAAYSISMFLCALVIAAVLNVLIRPRRVK